MGRAEEDQPEPSSVEGELLRPYVPQSAKRMMSIKPVKVSVIHHWKKENSFKDLNSFHHYLINIFLLNLGKRVKERENSTTV